MPEKECLRHILLETGAIAVGFAEAAPVPDTVNADYERWLVEGNNAGMTWMARHAELRKHPENVLPEVKTIISLAYPYGLTEGEIPPRGISAYARGKDYHKVIKSRLRPIVAAFDGKWRICIDSAPLPERFWAVKAGTGYVGDNGALIVPGTGGEVFLTEILTDRAYTPDSPSGGECLHCGACKESCPTGALRAGHIDCRHCISYLTIEHRGPWVSAEARLAMATEAGQSTVVGCDRCVRVCPLNSSPETVLPEFRSAETAIAIGEGRIPQADSDVRSMLRDSPISRISPDDLLRNLDNRK